MCISSIFDSRDWALAGVVGQLAKFLSLVAAEVSWLVMFAICTLSLEKMLWLDCVDVIRLAAVWFGSGSGTF